jgi:RNA polymerase sigma-70 factor (ECF subfamily)
MPYAGVSPDAEPDLGSQSPMIFGIALRLIIMTPNAFDDLVRPFRRELAAHCYRMLGSLQDAEDQVQETLISAWRGIDGFEGRSSVRAWLYKIATNRCLDEIRRRPRHGLPSDHGAPRDPLAPIEPAGELLWIEPCPPGMWEGETSSDAKYSLRESVQLAFVVALQHLPATQRAVLILRDVLGWSAVDVATLLESTTAAINSALQRARETIESRHRRTEPTADADALAARYVQAWQAGDIDALVALLHQDVTISMPPTPTWFRGRDAARAFFEPRLARPTVRHVLRVSGADSVMFASYRGERAPYAGYAIQVLQIAGGQITEMHAFMDRALLARFGAPATFDR